MFARLPAAAVAALLFLSCSSLAFADALIKPVPVPDYSRLSPDKAKELREVRAIFEQKHAELAGELLAEAYALLSAAYASNGFLSEAAIAMDNASLLAPKDGRWVYSRGVLAEEQKQLAVAQNLYDLALQLDPEYLPIRMAVVRGKLANNDLDGARKLLADHVARNKDEAAAYAALGDIALRQKRYGEAVTHLRRALALQPQATGLNRPLAEALAGSGDAKGAAEARAKAGNAMPGVPDAIAAGLLGRSLQEAAVAPAGAATPAQGRTEADPAARGIVEAGMLLGQRKYGEARSRLDQVLRQRPNDASALALYARVEASDGRLDAARSRATAAVAADRESALAQQSLGIVLEMSGDDAGAKRAYEQAVRLDGNLGSARTMLAELLLRTGDKAGAVREYREVVRGNIHAIENWMRLIGAYVAAGQCGEAIKDVSDLLRRDAKNQLALQFFVRLASTCRAATAQERDAALQIGADLYRDSPSPLNTEAYALALAAHGRWDDAVATQQAAIFVLVRNNQANLLPGYREILEQFQARRLPDTPWVRSAPVFNPQRMAPDPKPARANAK